MQASEWREGAGAAAEPNTGSTAGVGQYSSVGNKIKGVIPGTWARPCLMSVFLRTRALVGASRAAQQEATTPFATSWCVLQWLTFCKATRLIDAVHNLPVVLRSRAIRGVCSLVGPMHHSGTLKSSGAAQEHEAKKDNPNVRPHLEKDQATVGMGNEHVAPGAGGMHTEVRACTCCASVACPHGTSALPNLPEPSDQAAIGTSCILGDVPRLFQTSVAARAPAEGVRRQSSPCSLALLAQARTSARVQAMSERV